MKLTFVIVIVVSLLALQLEAQSCGSFTEFTLFPSPIQVGQTAHLRAVAPISAKQGTITGGVLAIRVNLNDVEVITFNNLPLCNISDAIQCQLLGAGSNNAINLDLPIPKIYPGKYTAIINATVYPSKEVFCRSVDLIVEDPDQTTNKGFFSYFQAALAGTAQFANPSVVNRQIGDLVQVGPVGAAPNLTSFTFPWGTFLSFSGTEDAITPYTKTNGFVWGLTGHITDISYSTTKRLHTYAGTFAVGYVSDLAKRQMDYVLLEGDFSLTWIFDANLDSVLTGSVYFHDNYGSIPAGWDVPITLARYGYMDVHTTDNKVIMVAANKTYCPAGMQCKTDGSAAIITPSSGLSGREIGIIVGVILGFCFLVGIVVGVVLWTRHRRHYEEEAGIFSSIRKPQYGNALVVDDIIQETREHTGSPVLPQLNHRGDSDADYVSEDDGTSSMTDSRSMSDDEYDRRDDVRNNNNNNNNTRPPVNGSRFSGERPPSRNRERSPGPSSRRDDRRSRSPPPRYSRDPPRRRDDDSDSYYSDAGSSASRATSDEE